MSNVAIRQKKSNIINLRVDDYLKDGTRSILNKHRLTHSKAIRLFLEYVINNDDLPACMLDMLDDDTK